MLRVVCHELASTWIGKRRRGLKARAFRTELTSLVQCLLLTLVVIAQSTGYDENMARRAAWWSSAAYGGHAHVDSWDFEGACTTLNPTGVQSFSSPTHVSAFGYTAVDVEFRQVVLAISGTTSINNVFTDLDAPFVDYTHKCELPSLNDEDSEVTYEHVHVGFCDYYKALERAGLTAEVMKLADAYPEFSVLVTGHSLGAAAAHLAAVDLVHRFKLDVNRILLYNFGSPRVGDGDFYRMQEILPRFFRVVHAQDAIVNLAPCCINKNFQHKDCKIKRYCPCHGGREIWYENSMGPDNTYQVCHGDGDGSCPRHFRMSLKDHMVYFEKTIASECKKESVVAPTM